MGNVNLVRINHDYKKEQKISICRTNVDCRRTKNLGRKRNQDYARNKKLARETNHDYKKGTKILSSTEQNVTTERTQNLASMKQISSFHGTQI
jgi:hypothetical protein